MSGDFCITPWTNTGRNVVSPIITMPHSSEAPLAAAIGLRPQSSSEIIGSGDRRSWITNSATATDGDHGDDPNLEFARGRDRGEVGHDRGDGDGEHGGA